MSPSEDSVGVTPQRRVKERTTLEAKTVEEEQYLCPNCSQWYDEDHIVDVGIGYSGKDNEEVGKREQMCVHCIESVFEFEVPDSAVGYALDAARVMTWKEILAGSAAVIGAVVGVATGLAMIIISIASLFTAVGSVSLVEAGASNGDVFGKMFGRMILVAVVLAFAVWASVGGLMELEDDDDE